VPRRGNANVAGLGALIIIGVLVMVAMSAVRTVDTGYIGVKTRFGKIVSDSLPAGLYFVIPGVEDIAQVEVREQKTEMSTSASSKDLQSIQSGIAINFRPDPANAHLLFKDVGTEYEARILDPAIEETVKAATARYTAEELITKRTAVRDEMETMLKDRVEGNHIMITKFNIVNFEFSDSFNHAIEEKQTAEQEALRATNILRRMKVEADQKIETARGAAESVKLQAAAEAEAITMKAIAEAEAQRILAEVVNRDVITLRAIEKWDGIMPKVTGETVPFISVDAKTVGGK
jgi:regulator of protease activity HflC (stomatin/prohibitin superfamily)